MATEGVVSLLLLLQADHTIDTNKGVNDGRTPFSIACQHGRDEVVKLLLDDEGIDITLADVKQCSPVWFASDKGHLTVIQLILASGRMVDITSRSTDGWAPWNNKTPQEIALLQMTESQQPEDTEKDYLRKVQNCPMIISLLDSFEADPVATRQQLRELPGICSPYIGEVFALGIFLCDDLLQITQERTSPEAAIRFFRIVRRLPMELQMMLCNRLFGSPQNHVLTKHSEPAFKKLARYFILKDPNKVYY